MDFERLYNLYSKDVYRYSLFNLKNTDDALDVVSETFTRLIESKDLENVGNIKAWIIRIARNVIYSKFRKEKKHVDLSKEAKVIIENQSDKTNMDETIINEELIEKIKNELDKIDDSTREIIILKLWEDMTFTEISNVVLEKESTVKLRYYRGLEKIKLEMQRKDKKKYVIAFPVLCQIINEISKLSDFSFGTDAAAQIWKELTNLNINLKDMVSENAVNKVGFINTPAFKILTGLVLTGIITSAVVISAVKLNTPKETTPSQTPTVTATPEVTQNEEITKLLETRLLEESGDRKFDLAFNSADTNAVISGEYGDSINGFLKFSIESEDFLLAGSMPVERTVQNFVSAELAFSNDAFGDVYYLVLEGKEGKKVYTFSNDVQSLDNCSSTSEQIEAPCGKPEMNGINSKARFEFVCFEKNEGGLEMCIELVKSLTVTEVE